VDRLKKKAVVDLSEELVKVTGERAALAARSPEELWLADLDVFTAAYEVFTAAKAVSKTTTATVKTKAKAKK
jgi:hypothetical protein